MFAQLVQKLKYSVKLIYLDHSWLLPYAETDCEHDILAISCFFAIMSLVKTCAIHLIVYENLKEKHFCEMHNKTKEY